MAQSELTDPCVGISCEKASYYSGTSPYIFISEYPPTGQNILLRWWYQTQLVHPEGPHLEGRRPEMSRARADALVVLVCGLSESTSRWTKLSQRMWIKIRTNYLNVIKSHKAEFQKENLNIGKIASDLENKIIPSRWYHKVWIKNQGEILKCD